MQNTITRFIFFFLTTIVFSCGQPPPKNTIDKKTVTLYGKITNPNANKVNICYYEKLTGEKNIADSAFLDKQGNFSITFVWNNNMSAVFDYTESVAVEMFLSPGDSLKITLDANNPEETVKYDGKGAEVNNYLAQKTVMIIENSSPSTPQERLLLNDSLHAKSQRFFNEYFSSMKDKDPFVVAFMEEEKAEINYSWAAGKVADALIYDKNGNLRERKKFSKQDAMLIDSFYASLPNEVSIHNPQAIRSMAYHHFVSNYVHYKGLILNNQDTTKQIDDIKREIIEKDFSGEFKEYLYANWVYGMLTNQFQNNVEAAKQLFEKYKSFAQNKEYVKLLDNAFSQVARLSVGNPAPDFTCPDLKGKMFSLKDFRGKIVYLSILDMLVRTQIPGYDMEMPLAKKFPQEMKNKNIVFLYVYTSDNEYTRTRIPEKNEINELYLISSEFGKLYNVKWGLPHYFIIDKEGKIANNNAKSPSSTDAKKELEALLK